MVIASTWKLEPGKIYTEQDFIKESPDVGLFHMSVTHHIFTLMVLREATYDEYVEDCKQYEDGSQLAPATNFFYLISMD